MQNIFYLMLKTTESNSNLGHPLPYFSLELKCVVLNRQIIGKIKIKIQICNYFLPTFIQPRKCSYCANNCSSQRGKESKGTFRNNCNFTSKVNE